MTPPAIRNPRPARSSAPTRQSTPPQADHNRTPRRPGFLRTGVGPSRGPSRLSSVRAISPAKQKGHMRRERNLPCFEALDSRLLMDADPSVDSVTILLGGGNDQLSVHVSEYSDTRVVSWTLNGANHQLNSPFFERVIIIDAGGNDTFDIGGGPIGVTFNILAANGDDTLKTGGSLEGRIKFDGGNGADRVIVDQTFHDDPENMIVRSDRVQWSPARYVSYISAERIHVFGSDVADTINVGYINADQTVLVHGGEGNDTLIIGDGDMDSKINGQLSVFGDAGIDTLSMQDNLDTGADAYRLDWVSVIKPGLMPFAIEYSAEKVDLIANHYANRIELPRSISEQVRVFGGRGDDQVMLGTSNLALLRNTAIFVDGGAGYDTLRLEDSTDAAHRTHTIRGSVYERQGSAPVTMAWNERVELHAGGGNNLIDASQANPINLLQLRGGSGNDTIFGSAGNDQIWGDAGDDSLLGNAGNDFLAGGAGNDEMDGGPGSDIKYQ
ncbi:MAG: calcium-binding protein [Anaerolineae bacterium]|nr:calcium-binding protein [Phycisphaerae bacterium]